MRTTAYQLTKAPLARRGYRVIEWGSTTGFNEVQGG